VREALIAVAVIGCGSTTPVTETVVDTGVEVAVDADPFLNNASGLPRCGPGPYLLHREQIAGGWGKRSPLVGATASTDRCPDLHVTSDETGTFSFLTTVGVDYDVLYFHPDTGRMAGGVFAARASVDWKGYTFHGDTFTLTDGVIHIVPWVTTSRPWPCNDAFGMRAWVEGHPEAKVHYFDNYHGVEMPGPDATQLRVYGITIDGLPFDTDVIVRAEQPNCRVEPHYSPLTTGKTRVHKGYRSGAPFEIFEKITPDAGASD
jgi:hypothetical protein